MKKSLFDKIASIIVFIGTIILFFVDLSEDILTKHGMEDLAKVIPFISALSLFCFIWSFIWDNKIIKLYNTNKADNNKFITEEKQAKEELIKESKESTKLFENKVAEISQKYEDTSKNLNEYVKAALNQPNRIESRILFEKETNLNNILSLQPGGSDFAQIYVITNAATVENERFGKAICENIINNHQYVYVSPFDEEEFMIKLHDTLFDVCPEKYDKNYLEAAFYKNIRHLQKKEIFDWLPEYSDMVIYVRKKIGNYDKKTERFLGYFSFQDEVIKSDGVECYYYSQMSEAKARQITHEIEKELINKPNLSMQNYLSSSVEIKNSMYNRNGLFCKQPIKKGDTIFKKGGTFVLKTKLKTSLKKDIQYVQVSDDYVVSALKQEDNLKISFPINHSCRNPNCKFETPIEIVASQDIQQGQEILIDYAFFDPDYCKEFRCNGCSVDGCVRKSKNASEILKEFDQRRDVLSPYLKEKIKQEV